MKFLLDACAASRSLHRLLTDLEHDVVTASGELAYATDEALLAMARESGRVIVTEDKDFGELVFVRRRPHPCVIRFLGMTTDEKVSAMRELLQRHADAMSQGAIIVVSRSRIRLRFGTSVARESRDDA